MAGAESEQPARGALAGARSITGEAVRGLFAQTGHADQNDCCDRQCRDDDCDGRAYYEPWVVHLTLHFPGLVVTDARSPTSISPMFLLI